MRFDTPTPPADGPEAEITHREAALAIVDATPSIQLCRFVELATGERLARWQRLLLGRLARAEDRKSYLGRAADDARRRGETPEKTPEPLSGTRQTAIIPDEFE